MSENLLNVDQVAERLGMNRRTVLKRRHRDGFPKVLVTDLLGKGYDGLRWAESEIDEWIKAKLSERP